MGEVKKSIFRKVTSTKVGKGIAISLGIIILLAALFAIFLLYVTITDYKPADKIVLDIENNQSAIAPADNIFSATIFNIGYCGLDKNQDFFMDGGTLSRSSSKEKTQANLESNFSALDKLDSDFLLLQEIDVNSTRSFKIDEYDYLTKNLPGYGSTFGKNYDVTYVPVPVNKPMGKVEGGIGTFSKFNISSSTRYNLPVEQAWPNSLFLLDRCVTENVVELDNGKKLVLLNLHLSAYDDGTVRVEQIKMLKDYMKNIYNENTYVVLGGDWNHYLKDSPDNIKSWVAELPDDFLPTNWQWAVDKDAPTVRNLDAKYTEGQTFTAVIDGFLVSPNVEIVEVTTKNLSFENSDHNPVTLKFKLK